MPSLFDKQFRQSGFPQLIQFYGEPVVYHLRAGGTKSFNAIIDRSPVAFYDAAGQVVMPKYMIRFLASCADSIQEKDINTGGDKVSFLLDIGDTIPVKCTVMNIASRDSSVIQLALA